ncbi:MAG: FeoB-associated Cys-rich membrane protein [Lachnospiraceae bacterium]|nr:FeoB-associated Cys-rich membrane protein [Lachnospiraceae bacterium]
MLEWIAANIGTILITLLLIMIVAGIVLSLIKDKKQGKSSCGGNCAHCQMCAACRQGKKSGRKPKMS